MSSYSASEALNSYNTNLISAIKDAIKAEISNIDTLDFDGISYSSTQILSGITIKLPTAISAPYDVNGQIPNVYLSYNGISLSAKTKSGNTTNNFIVEGFTWNNTSNASTILDVINIANYYNMNAYTAQEALSSHLNTLKEAIIAAILPKIGSIYSYSSNFSFGFQQNNDISILLPKYISIQDNAQEEIPNVRIANNNIWLASKNGLDSFIIEGFNTSISNEANNYTNDKVVNKLDSFLTDTININFLNQQYITSSAGEGLVTRYIGFAGVSLYKLVSSKTNMDSLISAEESLWWAIFTAIMYEIMNNKNLFIFDGIQYTFGEIASAITITLPNDVSVQNNESGQIPGIKLAYNGISLTAKTGQTTFTAIGFLNTNNSNYPTASQINNQIATDLGGILNNNDNLIDIDLSNINIQPYTAAIALYSQKQLLEEAVMGQIEDMIQYNSDQIEINKTTYTASQICKNITINFPSFVSLYDDLNGEMQIT